MWREYFGPQATIFGVDLDPACSAYETDRIKIFIGNQGDRNFWKTFRSQAPKLDIVIDDGSHSSRHQIITLQELLPHLSPGGVYLCEDVHREANAFACYVQGLASSLNHFDAQYNRENPDRMLVSKISPTQERISSISLYPYVTVIEKSPTVIAELVAPMHGSDWSPPRDNAWPKYQSAAGDAGPTTSRLQDGGGHDNIDATTRCAITLLESVRKN